MQMLSSPKIAAWFCALIAIAVSGCNGSATSFATVTGTVTADDQPLSGAIVTLEPTQGTTGPNASAQVLNGQFEIKPDAELHGGKYLVRVSMLPDSVLASIPTGGDIVLPPPGTVIDPAFDSNSQMIFDIEILNENILPIAVKFLRK